MKCSPDLEEPDLYLPANPLNIRQISFVFPKDLRRNYGAWVLPPAVKISFNAFLSADRTKTFFHGHSFTANPLACTAGLASLDLLEEKILQGQIRPSDTSAT